MNLNLTKLRKLSLPLTAIVFLIIIATFIWLGLKPKPNKQPTPTHTALSNPNQNIKIQSVTFPDLNKDLPERIPTVSISNQTLPSYYIQSYATNDKLTPLSGVKNVWTNQNSDVRLIYSEYSNSLSRSQTDPDPLSVPINSQQAIVTATSYVTNNFNFIPFLEIDTQNIRFWRINPGETHPSEVEQYQANFISIPFVQKLNNIPIYLDNSTAPTLELWITSNLVISSIIHKTHLQASTNNSSVALISLTEAVEEFRNGNGVIVTYSSVPIGSSQINLDDFTITDVGVEYRMSKGTTSPYYRFKGSSSVNGSDVIAQVEVVVPATKSN